MNIHEIILAWENNALPKDLDALAAIQNKVDDYWKKAKTGALDALTVPVNEMYTAEAFVYAIVSEAIQKQIDAIIPDPKPVLVVDGHSLEVLEKEGGVLS